MKSEIISIETLQEITKLKRQLKESNEARSKLTEEKIELEQELEDANDSIIWWQNRFKTKSKANDRLMKRINLAIEYIEEHKKEHLLEHGDGIQFEDLEQVEKIIDILQDKE